MKIGIDKIVITILLAVVMVMVMKHKNMERGIEKSRAETRQLAQLMKQSKENFNRQAQAIMQDYSNKGACYYLELQNIAYRAINRPSLQPNVKQMRLTK